MKSSYLKESLIIIVISFSIGIVYNTISSNGISLIRKSIELKWEKDSDIESLLKKDTTKYFEITNSKKEKSNEDKNRIFSDTSKIEINKLSKSKNIPEDYPDTIPKIETSISSNNKENDAPTAITLEQAYKLYQSGNATFIDARMELEYNLGHIKGAINIPFKKADDYISKIKHLSKESLLICYCDGSGCDLSIDLAKKLYELGYTNVKIFYSGWNDWKEKNYPMEKYEKSEN